VESLNPRSNTLELLSRARAHVQKLQRLPDLGGLALGVPQYDGELWRLGQGRLRSRENVGLRDSPALTKQRPDVYLATELYQHGGHTALIGDFVTALSGIGEQTSPPHLVVTNIPDCHGEQLPDRIDCARAFYPRMFMSCPALRSRTG
jgi:hypothetical protein